jgi:hypothetical protein
MRGQNNSKPVDTCPICKGDRFVCENHPRLAWPSECSCGAGDPCPVCNIAEPQVMPDDFVVDEEALDAALKTANSAFLDETSLPGRRTAQKKIREHWTPERRKEASLKSKEQWKTRRAKDKP